MKHSLKFRAAALTLAFLLTAQIPLQAGCGCMLRPVMIQNQLVATANAGMENKASQVILVRDGNHTTITMSNDYAGPVSDFAMVIPVPVVLQKDQIKTISPTVFASLNSWSAPVITESFDPDPCGEIWGKNSFFLDSDMSAGTESATNKTTTQPTTISHVKVEAQYVIDGYDIVILSATESGSLETWLKQNGYFVPESAHEVLVPYVESGMKFFVAKVHIDKYTPGTVMNLNPIQVSFDSPKFMLPIRLGMANSTGEQDLVIYAFSRTGRIEPTNYRMAKMVTDKKVPEFIAKKFNTFYDDTFKRTWAREGKTAIMLEFAQDLSGSYWGVVPNTRNVWMTNSQLVAAGVTWTTLPYGQDFFMADQLFFTRLHVRYTRDLYPQDLMFQVTANKEFFQSAFKINHPAASNFNCDQAKSYIEDIIYRRREELNNIQYLAGWNPDKYNTYVQEYELKYKNVTGEDFIPAPVIPWGGPGGPDGPSASPWTLLFILSLAGVVTLMLRMKRKPLHVRI
jgi:hypothetical protein